MRAIKAYLKGLGPRNIRPAAYGWFFNFFYTIFIYYGFYKVFSIPAGKAMLSTETGTKLSNFTFLADIFQHYQGSLPLVLSMAFVFTVVFLVVSVFVSGGIYAVLVDEESTSFTNLIANSTMNFPSMLKVALINLLNLVAALIVPLIVLLLFFGISYFYFSETMILVFAHIWAAVLVLFLTFSAAIYDFSRIYMLKEDRNLIYSFRGGITFTLSNKLSIFLVFVLYALSLALLYLVYFVVIGFIDKLLFAFLLFWVYQGFIFARYYLKVVIIRAEITLCEETEIQ
ncbi:MAG: hypothetical protein GY757_38140 [bacterium]|nr:hypothetical protein [bacterium]